MERSFTCGKCRKVRLDPHLTRTLSQFFCSSNVMIRNGPSHLPGAVDMIKRCRFPHLDFDLNCAIRAFVPTWEAVPVTLHLCRIDSVDTTWQQINSVHELEIIKKRATRLTHLDRVEGFGDS